jgi:hypothetical protein
MLPDTMLPGMSESASAEELEEIDGVGRFSTC